MLGPIEVEKWEWRPPGFPHEASIEEWVLPDKSDFLELSIKVAYGAGRRLRISHLTRRAPVTTLTIREFGRCG